MIRPAGLKALIWTTECRALDVLVVACIAGIAAFGVPVLSLTGQPERPAAEAWPSPAAPTLPPVPEEAAPPSAQGVRLFPWRAPEPFKPVLPEPPSPPVLPPGKPGFLTRLISQAEEGLFRPSTHDTRDSFYGVNWRADNIRRAEGRTELVVRSDPGGTQPYTAGEIQSDAHYGYGRYEAIMRPARGSGLVSAFFTYTGPWHGDPHDEIDIEFLGMDTTRIHFNYFRNGRRGRDATFDLPFDAADAERLYAFEWTPEGITWFVENVPYYATLPDDPMLPKAPGKIIFSAWTGQPFMQGWHGAQTFDSPAAAHVSCASYVPLGKTGRSCSDVYVAPSGG